MFRRLNLIAKTIFTEAIRRKEIYSIVLLTVLMLGWGATFRFFNMAGLHKFYQEIALKIMSVSTVVTVIVLASRQLPREFDSRTIYTVLAKPVSRTEFLMGKFLGVVGAGCFCFALFMGVFLSCNFLMRYTIHWPIFLQFVYLQFLLIVLAAGLSFALSLGFNQDASISMALAIFLLGQIFTSTITVVYEYTSPVGQLILKIINYVVPQAALYDLSDKVIHGWPPIGFGILFLLTGYTAAYVVIFLALSYLMFRRRPL